MCAPAAHNRTRTTPLDSHAPSPSPMSVTSPPPSSTTPAPSHAGAAPMKDAAASAPKPAASGAKKAEKKPEAKKDEAKK